MKLYIVLLLALLFGKASAQTTTLVSDTSCKDGVCTITQNRVTKTFVSQSRILVSKALKNSPAFHNYDQWYLLRYQGTVKEQAGLSLTKGFFKKVSRIVRMGNTLTVTETRAPSAYSFTLFLLIAVDTIFILVAIACYRDKTAPLIIKLACWIFISIIELASVGSTFPGNNWNQLSESSILILIPTFVLSLILLVIKILAYYKMKKTKHEPRVEKSESM